MNLKKILSITLSILILISLCSCSAPAKDPNSAVDSFCKAYQKKSYKKAFNYVVDYDGFKFDDRNEASTKKIIDAIAQTLDYKITGSTGTDHPYGVNVTITTVDIRKVYEQAAAKIIEEVAGNVLSGSPLTDSEFEAKITKATIEGISASGAPTVSTDAVFKLEMRDDNWYIIMDDLTVNIITGYMHSANENFKAYLSGNDVSSTEETESLVNEPVAPPSDMEDIQTEDYVE